MHSPTSRAFGETGINATVSCPAASQPASAVRGTRVFRALPAGLSTGRLSDNLLLANWSWNSGQCSTRNADSIKCGGRVGDAEPTMEDSRSGQVVVRKLGRW